MDPTSSLAQVTLAETYYHEIFYRWTDDLSAAMVNYSEHADRAVDLDPKDAAAHVQKGMALMLQQQRQAAIDSLSTAVKLNPFSPLAHSMLGQLLILRDEAAAGIEHLHKALRFSPNHEAVWGDYGALAIGYYVAEDFSMSIDYAERCVRVRPQFPLGWAMAAVSSAASGQQEKARHYVEQMLLNRPTLDRHELRFVWLGAAPALQQRFFSDLSAAGYDLH